MYGNYWCNIPQCFSVAEKHLGISSPLNPYEMKHPDKLALFTYISYFYDIFHDKDPVSFHGNHKPLDSPPPVHLMASSPPSRSWNTKTTLARPVTKETDVKLKRVVTPRATSPRPPSVYSGGPVDSSDKCYFCQKKVYLMERQSAQGIFFHRSCFRCHHCNSQLKTGNYSYSHGSDGEKGRFYCTPHFKQLFLSNPEAINYGRQKDGPVKKTSQHSVPSSDNQNVQYQHHTKQQDDQHKPQQDQKYPDKSNAKPIQIKPPEKGRAKVFDRIKNWETGNVTPVDTTPPSIHDDSRIIKPTEDNRHDDKVIERRLVHSYEDDSKQEIGKQVVCKQDDVKVVHKDTGRHDNSDEHSEDDDVVPLPSASDIQPVHSTPRQVRIKQGDDDDDDEYHRRSSRVISRKRLQLSKKHQTTMELSSNEDATSRRATRMNKMRSIGAPTRLGLGQKSIFRRMGSVDSDIQLTDNKLQEHRKHYSRLLKVCLSVCLCVFVCMCVSVQVSVCNTIIILIITIIFLIRHKKLNVR